MFSYEVRPADALTARFWENGEQMTDWEFFKRSVSRTFETHNTIGLFSTELDISEAERKAGEYDAHYYYASYDDLYSNVYAMPKDMGRREYGLRHKYALSEEDWKSSAWYDERIPYAPDMTPTRARILKENLDRRDIEDRALAHDNRGVWRTALGFSGSLVAGLPDPVNLIPFGTGAKAVTVGQAIRRAVVAGAAANVAADAIIFPLANAQGEKLGATDLLKDAMFGAVLGGGFGAFGYGMNKWISGRRPVLGENIEPGILDEALPTSIDTAGTAHTDNLDPGDDVARQLELDNELSILWDDAESSANRYEQRLDMADEYIGQLEASGYSREQAEAYGVLHVTHAEIMAPLFGQTPGEFLKRRLSGFFDMTPDEFRGLNAMDDLESNRAFDYMMQDMGVKPGMSRNQKRRVLQPEFEHVWGRVDARSFINSYGKSVYNDIRKQFGPGFFAKKGNGFGIDVLASDFHYDKRGAYDLNASDVDSGGFVERVLMPHDEFEGHMRRNIGAMYQTAPPTDSAEFRGWFGNSKVLDQDGEPLVVYHGTDEAFDRFDPKKIDSGDVLSSFGFNFTDSSRTASGFADSDYGGQIYPAYLSLKNPLILESTGPFDRTKSGTMRVKYDAVWKLRDAMGQINPGEPAKIALERAQAFKQKLLAEGYDGIILKDTPRDADGELNTHYIAFAPEQIKSVFNRGTFDGADPRILYQTLEAPDAVGGITPAIAEQVGIRPGALTLTEGALKHIEENHGAQIRSLGYADAHEFVRHVLSNVEAVYQGKSKRTFDFVAERANAQNERVLARIEFEAKGDRYEITTAGPVRESFYKKKSPLWEGARPSSPEETPLAARRASQRGQSGERLNLTKDGETIKTFLQSNKSAKARGAIRQLDDGRYIVGLFKNKDASTVIHESGHFFLENMREAAGFADAPQWLRDSWAKLQKAYGFDDAAKGEAWRGVQERFAREFEVYAREGKAPAVELQNIFNSFRDWLTTIYRNVRKLLGGKELKPEVRDVFDRLLANEREIELAHNSDALERVRGELLGQDRVKTGWLIDSVLRDIDLDRPLDVQAHAQQLGMDEVPYMPEGLPYEDGMPRADWTPEPQGEPAAPPVTAEQRPILDRVMDTEAGRLIQEGHATPEELALLEQHTADMEAVKLEEEAAALILMQPALTKADCIKAMTSAGVSADRAATVVDFVLKEKAALKAAGQVTNIEGAIAQKLAAAADAERIRLLTEKRNTALTIIKRKRLVDATLMLQEQGLSFERAVTTQVWGDRSRATGARDSAARHIDALRVQWRGELTRALDAVPGLGEAIRKDADFDAVVRQEMIEPGSTKDTTARTAAEILGKTLEDMRVALNDAGANIGKLEGYAPQNHSSAKLLKAGSGAWAARMLNDLDWERTMPGVPKERRAEALTELWTTIVTGQRRNAREPSGNPFRKPHNLAASFQQERTLHFKDAKTAAAYHAEFGEGTVLDAVLSRIERISRRAGLMGVFGPNPETMLESLFTNERLRLRNMTPDEVRALADKQTGKKLEAFEKQASRGNADAAKEWDTLVETLRAERIESVGQFRVGERKGSFGRALAVLMGETGSAETPTGAKIAQAMKTMRNVHAASSLGSAVLAAIGDIQTKALWYRHGGENVFEAVHRAFKLNLEGLQSAEKKEIGRALGFYADRFLNEFHARFSDGDAAPGWIARQTNTLFKISGLNAWTEAHKAAAGFYLSNRMADNAGKAFNQLDKHYAATLKRAGLENRWDLIRGLATKEADGNQYILPESARDLTDAQLEAHLPEHLREDARPDAALAPERAENFDAARARAQDRLRSELEVDLLGYIHDEVGYAVIEPDAKTRAVMTQGLAPGTVKGEAVRSLLQFKSFPIAYFQRILAEQRWLRAADEGSGRQHASGMVFAAAACALMGYTSITARDLTRGREPRDPAKLETVYASIMQGGGLSIFGDFFLGKVNRWGGGIAGTLLGPSIGTAADLVEAGQLAFHGEGTKARDQAIRLGMARLPYANLWWAKSALDYGMFFHLREWMSPGSLARSEKALQKDFNQRYLKIGGLDMTPSKLINRGGGFK